MADLKIQLKDFTTIERGLDGEEYVYISQDDKTRKVALKSIKDFIGGTSRDIENIEKDITKLNNLIGDFNNIEITDVTNIVLALNKLNNGFIDTIEYKTENNIKKVVVTYKNNETKELNISDILDEVNIQELKNVDFTNAVNGDFLKYDNGVVKTESINLNDVLTNSKSYTDSKISDVETSINELRMVVDEKPVLSADGTSISYKQNGADLTTENFNTYFYYKVGNTWNKVIFINGEEVNI